MRPPKYQTVSETSGSGRSASTVSRGLIASMNPIDASAVTRVLTEYMTPGPSIMRTAARSLVVRDMRSPVRPRWK